MQGESQIKTWRRDKRAELLRQRAQLSDAQQRRIQNRVTKSLRVTVAAPPRACLGFYWPFKGEIDLRGLLKEYLLAGTDAALPVVVEKNQPLEFWRWRPGMPMQTDLWHIPIPEQRVLVQPTVLLIPLVGFDAAGYRLGYGGGYYDRSLALMTPTPWKIGVGYELGRLPSIHPQAHDIPLDTIVTEAGVESFPPR